MMVAVPRVQLVASLVIATACGHVDFALYGKPTDDGGGTIGDGVMGDAATVQSCRVPASTCGPSGTSSCCGSPLVPGGMFLRSYDVGTDGAYVDSSNPANVSDFRLDVYEVTVG